MRQLLDLSASIFAATLLIAASSCQAQTVLSTKASPPAEIGIEKLVQYGKMHEVIGMQKHEGRVLLGDLLAKPHFYGVGALAGLKGEISIIDSQAVVTEVIDTSHPRMANSDAKKRQATLLIGAYVTSWKEVVSDQDLSDSQLDEWIQRQIELQGSDVKQPIVFVLRGSFKKVHLHVINGACPVHSRIKMVKIPEAQLPFDEELEEVTGEVVGVFAVDAAGQLTHPATRTHKHLVYKDLNDSERITGHVESMSVTKGARLMLPLRP